MVDRISFNQTAQVIKKSRLLICADGGLLHAANAVQTPIMALFYYIEPMVRLIKINPSYSLLDKNDINNISVINIIEKIKKLPV
jgi:ADP-heptose:LPS heptosyltransferase